MYPAFSELLAPCELQEAAPFSVSYDVRSGECTLQWSCRQFGKTASQPTKLPLNFLSASRSNQALHQTMWEGSRQRSDGGTAHF